MAKNAVEQDKRFKFTEARIRELSPPPNGKRFHYYDTQTSQLECRVTSSGAKTFNLYTWSKSLNEPIRVTLGRWPSLTVEDARQLAVDHMSEINRGNHPNRARRASRDALTLGAAIEAYLEWTKAQERKENTVRAYNYYATRFLSDWSNKKLSSITSDSIVGLRSKIRDRDGSLAVQREKTRKEKADRKVTANRVLRFLSQVFNYSIQIGWKGVNPCSSIRPFPEQPSKRRLEETEVGPFLRACEEIRRDGDLSVDYLLMCLYTGVRRRNVAAARWIDISLEFGTWIIPDTKNNLPQHVYISSPVKQMLNERKKLFDTSEFVFPAEGKSGHLEEPRKLLNRVLKKSGINPAGINIHALKHSFVSFAYEAGINPIVVSRMGGHKVPGITARYGHASERSIRDGYQRTADYIQTRIEVANAINVRAAEA